MGTARHSFLKYSRSYLARVPLPGRLSCRQNAFPNGILYIEISYIVPKQMGVIPPNEQP